MKIIIMFLILFIPNVFAESDGLSCSYDINGDTINFGIYYTSDNKIAISDFIVNGSSSTYLNLVSSNGEFKCPEIIETSIYGNKEKLYVLSDNINITSDDNGIVHYKMIDPDASEELDLYEGYVFSVNDVPVIQISSVNMGTMKNVINYIHYDTQEISSSGGVSDETRKQMKINIASYNNGACTYEEKTAISNYLTSNGFYSVSTFYGDNVFMYKNEYIKLSDECAKIASDLYNSVVTLNYMLSDYVDGGGNVNSINYLSLESNFYSGYSQMMTPWFSVSSDNNTCNVISDDVRNILNYLFDSFRLISIILTIFLTYLDGMKSLAAKDDSATKKWISNTIKRMISLIIILMLPLLINLVLDLVNKYMSNSYVYVDGECIKAITGG